MFHSYRRSRMEVTRDYTTWTLLQSWWCCTARSCLVWLLLPLLRQSWWEFLLSMRHTCKRLLPGSRNWSPPLTWLYVLISELIFLMLLVIILLFYVLVSIQLLCLFHSIALSMSLLVRSWSLPLLSPIRLMLSANRRLNMGLPTMETDVRWSWSVSCMIFSRNKLKRMGESKHPWWTLTVYHEELL